MSENVTQYNQIFDLAQRLPVDERVRLAKQLLETVERDLPAKPAGRSLYGILAEFGPAPSAEDIDEVRREMLANFPREDISI